MVGWATLYQFLFFELIQTTKHKTMIKKYTVSVDVIGKINILKNL